LQPA